MLPSSFILTKREGDRECHEITELLLLKEGQLGIGFKSNFPSDVSVGVVGIKHSRITSYLTKFSKGNKS